MFKIKKSDLIKVYGGVAGGGNTPENPQRVQSTELPDFKNKKSAG
ncbi:hypothetical protein [Pseudoalteromonas rubra]|nr:hypothetical protein [Pseudoalteromonas rubra]